MLILLLVSLVVFTTYIGICNLLLGDLPTISDSYYAIEKKYGYKYTWVFTIALWGFALPAMISGLDMSGDNIYQVFMFLSPAGICFVGAAPQFRQTLTDTVHYVGAFVGVIFGFLALIFIFNLWWVVLLAIVGIVYIWATKIPTRIYWIEVIAFYSIIFGLIFYKMFGN